MEKVGLRAKAMIAAMLGSDRGRTLVPMFTKTILLGAISALTLPGCETAPEHKLPSGHELTRHTWKLVEVAHRDSPSIKLTSAQQAKHQLQFNRDGTLSLTLDCNRGTSDWSASVSSTGSGTVAIGQVAATRALCPPPNYGEDMAADLPSAQGYTVMPGGRVVNIATHQGVYIFAAAD